MLTKVLYAASSKQFFGVKLLMLASGQLGEFAGSDEFMKEIFKTRAKAIAPLIIPA